MPFTTLGSSSPKNAWAMSTYSEITTRGRDILAQQDLIGAGAQDGAQNGIDAGQPPAFGQLRVDHRVDRQLLAHHALDQVAEEGGFDLGILAAVDLFAQAMGLELGDDLVEVDPGHVHLIEGLNRGEAGGAS